MRARARAELTRQIGATARAHLATDGAAGLSLRAVARDLGMVSSAVYRYVASRDELLTLLIVDAYDGLGAAAERAEARVARDDLAGRWSAVCQATRRWGLRNPHEWALIFGSPVPGYVAPERTAAPAARVGVLLIALLRDCVAAGAAPPDPGPLDPELRRAIAPIRDAFGPGVPDDLVVGGLIAWTHLLGAVSTELFGQRRNVVAAAAALREAFFTEEMRRIGVSCGLLPPP